MSNKAPFTGKPVTFSTAPHLIFRSLLGILLGGILFCAPAQAQLALPDLGEYYANPDNLKEGAGNVRFIDGGFVVLTGRATMIILPEATGGTNPIYAVSPSSALADGKRVLISFSDPLPADVIFDPATRILEFMQADTVFRTPELFIYGVAGSGQNFTIRICSNFTCIPRRRDDDDNSDELVYAAAAIAIAGLLSYRFNKTGLNEKLSVFALPTDKKQFIAGFQYQPTDNWDVGFNVTERSFADADKAQDTLYKLKLEYQF